LLACSCHPAEARPTARSARRRLFSFESFSAPYSGKGI
jgi:hypothetical protein